MAAPHPGEAPGSWVAALLDFERHGDRFRVAAPECGDEDRLFGGQIAAQALGAAGATIGDGLVAHSLHAYFVRGGRYGVDIDLDVERVRDGRSFATRRVTVSQQGSTILEMASSFQRPESGPDHCRRTPMPLAFPDAVPAGSNTGIAAPFDIRASPDNPPPWVLPPFWIRSPDPVEDDPLIRACAVTYLSDIGPVPAAYPPGVTPRDDCGFSASLDHSIWFHRPYDPDQWHCYDVTAVSHSNNRGLVQGALLGGDGTRIASTAQEVLWRR
ncbi:acyl-CoA thioesterase [Mycobacterium colombiense]|uniref:Acyl-CoA thioesterase II n=1 Tax=Mycobacterium colombiense TaxID=339268 RepID=A0A1A2YR47_9MYCO|nr:acyl-CoA thioesterase domain-containing protein [Mycobacterium colombiense]OBI39717.1 acyl-CoA thioesterase II [Mycobacterium colombiense]